MSATAGGLVVAFGGTAMLFASAERTLVMEDPSVGPQWCTLATPRIAEGFTARLAGPATPCSERQSVGTAHTNAEPRPAVLIRVGTAVREMID
jgi:hypothetical protein